MKKIKYINRITGQLHTEDVYGEKFIHLAYGTSFLSKLFSIIIMPLAVKFPFVSWLYGWLQKRPASRKKVAPFIKKYDLNATEFVKTDFDSFNDFFVRKLKPSSRPIAEGDNVACLPADARYKFYSEIPNKLTVKGNDFSLEELLQDNILAKKYTDGRMLIARLCPTDYHRFHFPCDCIPEPSRLINGYLHSVNPIAIQKNSQIMTQNKRVITALETPSFGKVIYIQVGAINVGSIYHTYVAGQQYKKGDEVGFFAFGASALIIIFEADKITFDKDLLSYSQQGYEIRGLMGQPMGKSSAL